MGSLSRRVLSSDLRSKLEKLASLSPSSLIAANDSTGQGTLCNDKIGNVTKARLWRMMQKTLYNPRAARHLKPVVANGDAIQSRNPDEMLEDGALPSLQAGSDLQFDNGERYDLIRPEGYSSYGDDGILEDDELDLDILISGESESYERTDEDLLQHEVEYLYQEHGEIVFSPRDSHLPHYNTQHLIPCELYANSDWTNTLPNSHDQGVDYPTTNDDKAIHFRAATLRLTDRQETQSSFRHSPRSGASSSTPNDDPTFTYDSVFRTQRSDEDEDILFHSDAMIGQEQNQVSFTYTPDLPNDNVFLPHEHLIPVDRSDDNEDLLFPQRLHFYTVKEGRQANDHHSDNEDEGVMIDI